jgi:hypothetical protein
MFSIFSTCRQFVGGGYFGGARIAVLNTDLDATEEVGFDLFQHTLQLCGDLHGLLPFIFRTDSHLADNLRSRWPVLQELHQDDFDESMLADELDSTIDPA